MFDFGILFTLTHFTKVFYEYVPRYAKVNHETNYLPSTLARFVGDVGMCGFVREKSNKPFKETDFTIYLHGIDT